MESTRVNSEEPASKGAGDQIERGDAVNTAFVAIRNRIIEGTYAPGRRLTQREISAELGVGRTPLREALRMLEAEGYVESEANRGISVTQVDVHTAEDLYALRLLIEPPLLCALTPSFEERELDEMDRLLEEMRSSPRLRDFQHSHLGLHVVALERYGSTTRDLILDLFRRVQRLQRVYMSRPRVLSDVVDIDQRIVDALRRRDGVMVKHLMEFHLLDWAVGLITDVEPDHRFEVLLRAARGIGIEVAIGDGAVLTVPVDVRWSSDPGLPDLTTSNLQYRA